MLRHRAGFHQAFVTHHTDGEADIRQLHKHQAGPEVVAHFVIANDRRTNNRQQRTQRIAPAQATLAQQIVNQRDIERRQHGKQQEFGYRQVNVSAEAEQIHDAELHRPHQHVQQNGFSDCPRVRRNGRNTSAASPTRISTEK
jgi:hypothetical protein